MMAKLDDEGRPLDPKPKVKVIGHMDGKLSLVLGWEHGMRVISLQRFKFLRDDLGFEIEDNPGDYLW